jgi:uncharacterized protein
MTSLPMFPLGSVLFPSMPLVLRVFEQRYLQLLAEVVGDDEPEFGVVLIERGQEVGGGDARFGVGAVARITELDVGDGFIALIAVGTRRIEVVEWVGEQPFPRAVVRELPALEWSELFREQFDDAEHTVRSALRVASEFVDLAFSPDIELAGDPVAASWQLAAIAPIGELDRVRLLAAADLPELLARLVELTEAAVEQLRYSAVDDAVDDTTDDDGGPDELGPDDPGPAADDGPRS